MKDAPCWPASEIREDLGAVVTPGKDWRRGRFRERESTVCSSKGRSDSHVEEAIARLRESKKVHISQERESGMQAGRHWALQNAEYGELYNLAERRECSMNWETYFSSETRTVAINAFFSIIKPEGSQYSTRELFGVEEEVVTPAYVQGFAEGALQAWNEVKDRI